MAPVISRVLPLGFSDNAQDIVTSHANPGLAVLLAVWAFAFLVLVVVVYLLVRLFYTPKAEDTRNPYLRKLVLPSMVAEKHHSKGTGRLRRGIFLALVSTYMLILPPSSAQCSRIRVFFQVTRFSGSSEADKVSETILAEDIEAQVHYKEAYNQKETKDIEPQALQAVLATVDTGITDTVGPASPATFISSPGTLSLCDDFVLEVPSMPSSWFDLDNLLATPTEELEVFHSSSGWSDSESDQSGILSKRSSTSPLVPFKRSSMSVGLGFDLDTVPIIAVDDCETRSTPPEDVNFVGASSQSPFIICEVSSIDYLDVPSPRVCASQRRRAERAEATRSWIHSMSLNAAVASSSPRRPGHPDPQAVSKTMALLASLLTPTNSRTLA
ncbi:hypothetical protein BXZ70DRAFT_703561 [Cristinia sonorae]|uniref:Uncharacterized protein n=1 Tax=Cristinia sonorae TaxID=1940300 RepID=A0A8K0UE26_9AGAR|nr:hypothetical protein BXZ70DRAFT_703561 [Cristinia sonorae]